MIIAILILTTLFIALAFAVTENNAKYLLSGYNTMSEVERQNYDIKSYIPYFRKFHLFLGISLLIISLILFYCVNSDWSGLFLGSYPILAYVFFIWKSDQFTINKSKKQIVTRYISMSVMFLLFIIIIYAFNSSLKDNEIIVTDQKIEITGQYGLEINFGDLKSMNLVDKLPEIKSKKNGFALETIKKGIFKIANGEKVKLLINSNKSPIILFIYKDNQKIYYSSKEKSNIEIFSTINKKFMVKK